MEGRLCDLNEIIDLDQLFGKSIHITETSPDTYTLEVHEHGEVIRSLSQSHEYIVLDILDRLIDLHKLAPSHMIYVSELEYGLSSSTIQDYQEGEF